MRGTGWWCVSDWAVGIGPTVGAAFNAWRKAMEGGWYVVKALE